MNKPRCLLRHPTFTADRDKQHYSSTIRLPSGVVIQKHGQAYSAVGVWFLKVLLAAVSPAGSVLGVL
jgi:hypothetical protein